jgi:RimJ/RimL family protein N-acetyltransferase
VARADDAGRIQAALRSMSAESRYTRFMSALREATPKMLEQATHSDSRQHLQLLAVTGEPGAESVVGGTRFDAAEGSRDCEFAIAIVDGWQGAGLARQMLEALMRAAAERGFERMEGYILASNAPMLGLASKLGFQRVKSPEEPEVRLLRCELRWPAGA